MKMDSNLLWACKMVLLDQLNTSRILKEHITYKEKEKFEGFIKNLNLEQVLMILSEKPNLSDEERQGLLKLGWPSIAIDHLGTHTAKAAFWNQIKPPENLADEMEKEKKRLEKILQQKKKTKISSGSLPSVKPSDVIDLEKQGGVYQVKQKVGLKLGLPAKIAIGVGIATLLAIGAYYVYKRYKDQCRRQCKYSTDPNCIKKCRGVATKASINRLQATKVSCGKDQRCIVKADKEIRRWQTKLAKIEQEGISWGVVQQLKQTGKMSPPPPRPASYSSAGKSIVKLQPLRKW
jgi:hypothetical protein